MATATTTLDRKLAERERIVARLREAAPRLRALGVERLWLFGSIARGEAGPESDVDLLIETDPDSQFSLFDVVDLQDDLENLFGRRTHFAFGAAMRSWLREDILEEAISIF
jgi:uncharacterized protein